MLPITPDTTFAKLLKAAGKETNVKGAKKLFLANGVEVTELDDLKNDDVLFVSAGEPMYKSGASARCLCVRSCVCVCLCLCVFVCLFVCVCVCVGVGVGVGVGV